MEQIKNDNKIERAPEKKVNVDGCLVRGTVAGYLNSHPGEETGLQDLVFMVRG